MVFPTNLWKELPGKDGSRDVCRGWCQGKEESSRCEPTFWSWCWWEINSVSLWSQVPWVSSHVRTSEHQLKSNLSPTFYLKVIALTTSLRYNEYRNHSILVSKSKLSIMFHPRGQLNKLSPILHPEVVTLTTSLRYNECRDRLILESKSKLSPILHPQVVSLTTSLRYNECRDHFILVRAAVSHHYYWPQLLPLGSSVMDILSTFTMDLKLSNVHWIVGLLCLHLLLGLACRWVVFMMCTVRSMPC